MYYPWAKNNEAIISYRHVVNPKGLQNRQLKRMPKLLQGPNRFLQMGT